MPAFQLYRGKPAVRNDREGRGKRRHHSKPGFAPRLYPTAGARSNSVPTATKTSFGLRLVPVHDYLLLFTISTVAVMPAARVTPSGTWSIWMRTGIRCAKRTHVKIGLTCARPRGPAS